MIRLQKIIDKTEVNFEEFIDVLKKADKKSTPDNDLLNSSFYEFDVEGDGLMTPKQFRYSMQFTSFFHSLFRLSAHHFPKY